MLDQLISQVPLVFLDTETTGLYPHYGDRMVEIAFARFRGDVMEDYYVTLLNPGRSISPGASRIHGITDADVADKPRFAEIIPALRSALDGVAIVAHNAPFDLGFVGNEYGEACQDWPDNLVLDTLSLLRRHFTFRSNSLPRVARELGIPTERFHRALADVLTTRELFRYITVELGRRGARTFGDFLNLQGGTVAWSRRREVSYSLPPALEEALRLNCKIMIRYNDGFGFETERWVTPIAVRGERDYVYLRAFCHLRNGERSFRLDRLQVITQE